LFKVWFCKIKKYFSPGTTALNRQRKCLHATFSYSGEGSTVGPRRGGTGGGMGEVQQAYKMRHAA